MIQRPLYTEKIFSFLNTPLVKILTGIRRCGKSTILLMLMEKLVNEGIEKERILHYNFDSMQYEDLKKGIDLYHHLKNRINSDEKTYLFLDEIQEVESWEKVLNSLMVECNVDIYVTGSNSKMMASEISTYLTGRYVQFRIYPLSFSEYLNFRKEYLNQININSEFSRYLRLGGFPATHLQEFPEQHVDSLVKDIYNSVIFSDIVRRNEIRKIDQLERIVRFIFDNIGRTFSASSISKYFKSEKRSIDIETIYSYLNKLENAYIIQKCSRFDIEGKEILKTQEKYYLADPSLRYSILGFSLDSIAAMIENIVYLELSRRGYSVFVGKIGSGEIDFIATKQENKLYIQVTQQINSEETEKREYGRLLEINDAYPKYALSYNTFAGGNYEGIKSMNISDFLLSDEY